MDFDALLRKGNILLAQNDLASAESCFAKAIDLQPAAPQAKVQFAQVAIRKGDLDAALRRYKRLALGHPNSPIGHIGIANVLLKQGRVVDAEEKYIEIVCRYSNLPKIVERCIFAAARTSSVDLLCQRFESLREEQPTNSNGLFGLCLLALQQGDSDQAEALFAETLTLYPGLAETSSSYASILTRLKDLPALYRGYKFLKGQSDKPLLQLEEHLNREMFHQFFRGGQAILQERFAERSVSLVVAGDSHAGTLFGQLDLSAVSGKSALLFVLPATTTAGFGKRASSLNTFANLQGVIDCVHPDHVVLKFGQVDVDLGLYYRVVVKKRRLNVVDFFTSLIDKYLEAVLLLPKNVKYTVCGINLPSIRDHAAAVKYTSRAINENVTDRDLIKLYTDSLRKCLPDYRMRTIMSLKFNSLLKARCEQVGLSYFDYTDFFLDKETGLLLTRFACDHDHHYLCKENDRLGCTRHMLKTIGLV